MVKLKLINIIKRRLINILFLFLLFTCLSCQKKETKNTVEMFKTWMNKTIIIPKTLKSYNGNYMMDTLKSHNGFSILSYVDSIGCLSCRFNIEKWTILQNEMNKYDVPILIYIHSNESEQLKQRLRRHKTKLNICFDEKDSLNTLNNFPLEVAFQTFLLDRDKKIVAIGNPIHNHKVMELYMNIISGNSKVKERKVLQTEILIEKQLISLGCFNWQKEQKATFTIKNVGKFPLVINDIFTSCGCTSVEYSKEPVRPGDIFSLHVLYKADKPEYFKKTITIYCNANPSVIQLNIVGDAK